MMQRVSGGLTVPKHQMDVFTGKTTGTGANAGEVTCELTYTPKGINHFIIPPIKSAAGLMQGDVQSITGKTLLLKVYYYAYGKTDSPTSNATGACDGSGGAASHGGHTLTYTADFCLSYPLDNIALGTIRANYTVG